MSEMMPPRHTAPPPHGRNPCKLRSTGNPNSSQAPASDNKEKAVDSKAPATGEEEEEVDIDLEAPETEKAALAIQNQFRRFKKNKK